MNARRVYETTIIVNAALEDQDIDAVVNKVSGYIENHGGEVKEINKWGRRRLAYPINKKYNGFYVHVVFDTNPSTVPILERFLVLEDTILRHLTLVLPEKLREYRRKRALEQGRPEGSGPDDQMEEKPKPGKEDKKENSAPAKQKAEEKPAKEEKEKSSEETDEEPAAEAEADTKPENEENGSEEEEAEETKE